MRIFQYDQYGITEVQEITEGEILREYWAWWYSRMVDKYGEGHKLITKENCIEDWTSGS